MPENIPKEIFEDISRMWYFCLLTNRTNEVGNHFAMLHRDKEHLMAILTLYQSHCHKGIKVFIIDSRTIQIWH